MKATNGKALAAAVVALCVLAMALPMDLFAQTQTSLGYGREWLLLGHYDQEGGGGDNPGIADMQQDYLQGGGVTEASFNTVLPVEGTVIASDFSAANCTGFNAGDLAPLFANPTVFYWFDPDAAIDYSQIFGDYDQLMTYSWCVARNKTGADLNCWLGIASDDSMIAYLNGVEVGFHEGGRGQGNATAVQDALAVTLLPGDNIVMLKVFEGGGGHGFKCRLQNVDTATGDNVATTANMIDPAVADLLIYGVAPDQGWMHDALLLGQYTYPRFTNDHPTQLEMQTMDYLFASAAVSEATLRGALPLVGQQVNTVFNGNPAYSSGLNSGNFGHTIPTVVYWYEPGSLFNFDAIYGAGNDETMVYTWAKIVNKTGAPITDAYIGFDSDDSAIAYLNGVEIGFFIHNVINNAEYRV